MTIHELIKKFTINPREDIEPHFTLTKELNIDASNHTGCFNCGDTYNTYKIMSESWTAVQVCNKCKHLNVIYYQDRMGGTYTDTVRCFTDLITDNLNKV